MAGSTFPGASVAGVELGGTKCICTLGRGPNEIDDQITLPTDDPDTTLPAIAAQLKRWRDGPGFASLGIGSFGPIDIDPASSGYGRIQRTAKAGWSGAAVLDGIAGAFDGPIRLDTDVNAAALAERRWGIGRGAGGFAYVTVGTGVGVGFAHEASGGVHAELGHIRAVRMAGDDHASVCPYHDDCIEGLASGKAIAARFGDVPASAIALDDPRWNATIDYLGQLCHVVLCATPVDRIAFGGGVVVGNPGLIAAIEHAMRRSLNGYLTLPEDRPVIVAAGLGGQAGPLGSLALALDALVAATVPDDAAILFRKAAQRS